MTDSEILSSIPAGAGDTTGDRLLSPRGSSDTVRYEKPPNVSRRGKVRFWNEIGMLLVGYFGDFGDHYLHVAVQKNAGTVKKKKKTPLLISIPRPCSFLLSAPLFPIHSHFHLPACDRLVISLNSCSCKHSHSSPCSAAPWQLIHTVQMCLTLRGASDNNLLCVCFFLCAAGSHAF